MGFDKSGLDSECFKRTISLYSEAGHSLMRAKCILVIGLGGTGNLVVQLLHNLGYIKIIGIDPDVIENKNRDRMIGVSNEDVGKVFFKTLRSIDSVYIHQFANYLESLWDACIGHNRTGWMYSLAARDIATKLQEYENRL